MACGASLDRPLARRPLDRPLDKPLARRNSTGAAHRPGIVLAGAALAVIFLGGVQKAEAQGLTWGIQSSCAGCTRVTGHVAEYTDKEVRGCVSMPWPTAWGKGSEFSCLPERDLPGLVRSERKSCLRLHLLSIHILLQSHTVAVTSNCAFLRC